MILISIAGILSLIVGFSRVIQIKFFERDRLMIPSVLFGFVYLFIGVAVFYSYLNVYTSIVAAAIVAIFAACVEVYRYFKYQQKPLIIFHVFIDFLILALVLITFAYRFLEIFIWVNDIHLGR